jgi:hypothetical protein
MLRLFGFIISLLFFSCNIHEQPKVVDEPKNYDTLPNGQRLLDNMDSGMDIYYREVVGSDTLKGGYITCYGVDDSMRYFYLRHGDTLHLLNKSPTNTTAWSAGTFEADYYNFFIIRIDNGNQVPESYQIFDKKTCKNLLGKGKEFYSYKAYKGHIFLIFTNLDRYDKPDTLFLYNATSDKKTKYKLPGDIPEYLDLRLEKISEKIFTISYSDFSSYNSKEKTYNR